MPISIVDLGPTLFTGGSSFPIAGFRDDEEDYIASEGKVGILYAAYAFRDMVRRFNTARRPKDQTDLFKQLRATMSKPIASSVRRLLSKPIPPSQRLPTYEKVLSARKLGGTLTVEFLPAFVKSLDDMIIPSDNNATMRCVHGLGFSYLNGALAAAGLFNDSTGKGLWVGGDFQMGKVWTPAKIATANDTASSVASTSDAMVRLISLIVSNNLLDSTSCQEMSDRLILSATVGPDTPWLTRPGLVPPPLTLDRANVSHNKLGLGPLNAGAKVWSEVSVLNGLGSTGRNYAVAWQNLTPLLVSKFTTVAAIIRGTITAYEAIPIP
jgi:hypothetical protein